MTPAEFAAALGREVSATDQMPGTYRCRRARKKEIAPVEVVRLVYDGIEWHCLLNGVVQTGSGARDPMDIPFVLWNAPFWPITEAEYMTFLRAYQEPATATEET